LLVAFVTVSIPKPTTYKMYFSMSAVAGKQRGYLPAVEFFLAWWSHGAVLCGFLCASRKLTITF
jgi:hypothetical protein